jgi:hypothetical protein
MITTGLQLLMVSTLFLHGIRYQATTILLSNANPSFVAHSSNTALA